MKSIRKDALKSALEKQNQRERVIIVDTGNKNIKSLTVDRLEGLGELKTKLTSNRHSKPDIDIDVNCGVGIDNE